MKQRVIKILLTMALLLGGYVTWAYLRCVDVMHGSSRGWPYPDRWLADWERTLNAANPAPHGTLKFEGDFLVVELWLIVTIALLSLAATGLLIWLFTIRKRIRNAA